MLILIKPPVGHTIGVTEECSAQLSKLHNVDSTASGNENWEITLEIDYASYLSTSKCLKQYSIVYWSGRIT